MINDEEHDIINYILNPRRMPCFIHKLLLCLKPIDHFNETMIIISKAKKLIETFSHSTKLTSSLIKKCGLKLIQFSNTRWNITYLVFDRILRIKTSIIEVLNEFDRNELNLDENEWQKMEEMHKFLKPFNVYTDMSNKEANTTISEIICIIKELKIHIERYLINSSLQTLCEVISTKLNKSFDFVFCKENGDYDGIYLAATFVDPRFRCCLDHDEKQQAIDFIQSLKPTTTIQLSEDYESETISTNRNYNLLQRYKPLITSSCSNLRNQINNYIKKAMIQLMIKLTLWIYWIKNEIFYPNLWSIAEDILSIPLSIGAVERVFSIGGIALAGRRGRLDGSHLEREIFLTKNKHLIKNLID